MVPCSVTTRSSSSCMCRILYHGCFGIGNIGILPRYGESGDVSDCGDVCYSRMVVCLKLELVFLAYFPYFEK
jgi:hypothetical protein